jgi:hypothetical protein
VPATLPDIATIVAEAYCPVVTVPARDPSPDAVDGPVVLGAAPRTGENVIELAFQETSHRGAKLLAVRAWSEPAVDLGWLRADRIGAWDSAEQRVRLELDHALSAWTIINPGVPVRRWSYRTAPPSSSGRSPTPHSCSCSAGLPVAPCSRVSPNHPWSRCCEPAPVP